MKTLSKMFPLLFLALLLFSSVNSCDKGSSPKKAGTDADSSGEPLQKPEPYTKTIGPEGGIVSDPNGASVEIPAGALSESTEVSITTYSEAALFNQELGLSPFTGGAVLEPEGLTFLKPVSITLPSDEILIAGNTYSVFLYDKDPDAISNSTASQKEDYADKPWGKVKTPATASADGKSVTFTTNHFSTYASSGFSSSSLQIFGEDLELTGDPALAFELLKAEYEPVIGTTKKSGSNCYEAVAVYVDVMGTYKGTEFQELELLPEDIEADFEWDNVTTLSYMYDSQSSDCVEEECSDTQMIYQVIVNIYWKKSECGVYHVSVQAEFSPKECEMPPILLSYKTSMGNYLLSYSFDFKVDSKFESTMYYTFGSARESVTFDKPAIIAAFDQMYDTFSVVPVKACSAISENINFPSSLPIQLSGSYSFNDNILWFYMDNKPNSGDDFYFMNYDVRYTIGNSACDSSSISELVNEDLGISYISLFNDEGVESPPFSLEEGTYTGIAKYGGLGLMNNGSNYTGTYFEGTYTVTITKK